MAERKWYSNELKESEVSSLTKSYARVYGVSFGLNDRDLLALSFSLQYEDCGACSWELRNPTDIHKLLSLTGKTDVQQLEDVVIEAYCKGQTLRGISVNPNLVPGKKN